MKYLVMAGALAFTLCAGICEADDLKAKDASNPSAPSAQAEGSQPSKLKHIDLGENEEQNVSRVGVMAPGQSYDENTGFPDITNSDSGMNLD